MRCVLLIASLLLSSCGEGNDPPSPSEISSTVPENNSLRTQLVPAISVTFSTDIDPDAINAGTFRLHSKEGSQVSGTVTYDEHLRTAYFSPAASLRKSTDYTATVAGEIFKKGSPDFSWKFRTYGFLFIVLSDTHIRSPYGPDKDYYNARQNAANLQATVALINDRYPTADFVIVTGDMVGCLYSSNPNSYGRGYDTPADRFKAIMDQLVMPYHVALGNHDYEVGFDATTGEGISAADYQVANVEAIWRKLFGRPSWYSFDNEGMRFYILNSLTGHLRGTPCPGAVRERMCEGSFSDDQMKWLENDLAESSMKSFLSFHNPIYTDDTRADDWAFPGDAFMVNRGEPIYDILRTHGAQVSAIFTGHGHIPAEGHLARGTVVFETPSTGDLLGEAGNMNVVSVLPDTGEFYVIKEGN